MQEDLDKNEDLNQGESITRVTGMYKDWFLDYASYVILERAVPSVEDGFKPVQRRIMQSMKDLDDGRYNKVANIVGHTMQYHPHGDASIADAMVQIGQKDLLIDTQGNWGNILTGDRAAASRYIEARLSKFALDVIFNPKVTNWQSSYDGRRKEPINLPVKFPLLLAQGAEGIAVGLSTKILSHNFNELIDASVKYLKNKRFTLYPDFITGGIADFTNYNDGKRGGKVRVRAKINIVDKSILLISELPYSTTTTSLIDSIIKANDKGKIKIKKIDDNTSSKVEILIHLPSGISPDKTIDALYAFTNCEVSISPLSCIIENNKPCFLGVSEILIKSTDNTVNVLKKELEIRLQELEDQWHNFSLERIFIENKIYRNIEKEETWEGVLKAIRDGITPFTKILKREVTNDDIARLTEIKIKRISKFDIDKAKEKIENLEDQISEVKANLGNLIEFAISYFTRLKKDYSSDKNRRTEIKVFDDVDVKKVVMRNTKLYVNREEGFIGTSLRRNEYVCDCSDIDDVIVFTDNCNMMVTKVASKTFIGKNIIHLAVFKKKDVRTIYNMVYRDGDKGFNYIKRFAVSGVTRDKLYPLSSSKKPSLVKYFSANPNGEAEKITINLRQNAKIKKLKWDVDFSDVMIKGRGTRGNILTKNTIKNVELKEKGVSTLKPRKIWFDETVQKLNVDGRGELLGEFRGDDKILVVSQSGSLKIIQPELSTHFNDDMIVLEKWIPKKPISAIYFDGKKEKYFAKRFLAEKKNKEEVFISENKGSFLELISTDWRPVFELVFIKLRNKDQRPNQKIVFEEFISVKGIKAQGNQLTPHKIKQVNTLESLEYKPEDDESTDEVDSIVGEVKEDENDSSSAQTTLF
ncbi:MAG: DNA topoisomerase IV [Flavobacteriaceae bacterium]|nr:DNA topoisomerase IV [Flavobacteriaceae bacterium]OUV87646.1 MAG: DNA topoisomerase IV [Flavobacteriaceae bacterium TMED145]|tara:strand:+ start:7341 stop:9935 length:2595 start_codon:yes stop_codon:yes gene_type:complete